MVAAGIRSAICAQSRARSPRSEVAMGGRLLFVPYSTWHGASCRKGARRRARNLLHSTPSRASLSSYKCLPRDLQILSVQETALKCFQRKKQH